VKVCPACIRGLHPSCKSLLLGNPKLCECSHSQTATTSSEDITDVSTVNLFSTDPPDIEKVVKGRKHKPDAALKDQQSTGRKRAAKLYPLDREATCEWAELDNCGGGTTILGCGRRRDAKGETIPKGKQECRHHGPDYNTLNNDSGNVHRICHRCHNAWHTVNDPVKGDQYLIQYGHKPKAKDLSTAAKEMRSGGPSSG